MKVGSRLAKPVSVLSPLLRALPVLFSARIFALVLLPLFLAAIAWLVVAWLAWTPLVGWLSKTLFSWSESFGPIVASLLAAVILMIAAVVSALVAIAVFAMPVIVDTVAAKDFPTLERRKGGTATGSLVVALGALVRFVPLWLLALPLLVFPPAYVVVSIVLNAWLNRRMLPYDALSTHADPAEMQTVINGARSRLFRLGLIVAPLSLVPVVNLFVSLIAGIAFTYLCLDELSALRARSPLSGAVSRR